MKVQRAEKVNRNSSKQGMWSRWKIYREFHAEQLDFWHQRDPAANEQTRLPDGESVHIPSITVTELYTPSTVAGLLKGISSLGWEYGKTRDDKLTKWMRDVREGKLAGWTNLGTILPRDSNGPFAERTATLPSGVHAAHAALMSITSSLTALIVTFVFDDNTADILNPTLRESYQTITEKTHRSGLLNGMRFVFGFSSTLHGHRLLRPDIRRRELLQRSVNTLESRCTDWVKDNFPGAFQGQREANNPTVVLLVTENIEPMTQGAEQMRAVDGLSINNYREAWQSDEWCGTRLVLPSGWDERRARLTCACRRRDAVPKEPYHDPSCTNWSIAYLAHERLQGLASRWSLTCLLNMYHQTLSIWRDQTAVRRRYRTIRDLKQLRKLSQTTFYDIDVCTEELSTLSGSQHGYCWDVIDFHGTDASFYKDSRLLESLRSSQVERSRQIIREMHFLRSALETSNNLSQTISGVRVQRVVVLLTLISIAIATWAAFMSFEKTLTTSNTRKSPSVQTNK